jgi:HTH-type transcriptional regulator/antitoxin HigA
MMNQEILPHWSVLRPYLFIRNEADYDRAVEQMNGLIDIVGTNEDHPMYEFLDT